MISMLPKQILLVDDDSRLLQAMSRSLYHTSYPWEFTFATSGKEAMTLMEQRSFDLLITDMQMPHMTGAELLSITAWKHPEIIRFALSGYSDQTTIISALGLSHQYFSKPCDTNNLWHIISRVFRFRTLLDHKQIHRNITALETFPLLPKTMETLSEALNTATPCYADIAHIASTDVGLTAKLLHIANWSFFTSGTPICSLEVAIEHLGIDLLRSMVLASSVFRVFDESELTSFAIQNLYSDSISTSKFADRISQSLGANPDESNDARMAALLQDIGRLLLIVSRKAEYQVVYEEHLETGLPLEELETKMFGVNHADAGRALLTLWGIPDSVVDAIEIQDETRSNSSPLRALAAVRAARDVMKAYGQDRRYPALLQSDRIMPVECPKTNRNDMLQ